MFSLSLLLFLCLVSSFLILFFWFGNVFCQFRVVGSNAVFPYAAITAEYLANNNPALPPVIEKIGTGAGIRLFCANPSTTSSFNLPEVVNTSRLMTQAEENLCARNGHAPVQLVKIGIGGIALVTLKGMEEFSLTPYQLALALSKYVPVEGEWVLNPYQTWSQIDSLLPNKPILFYGPSATAGLRESLTRLLFTPEFCQGFPLCSLYREDAYVEIPEDSAVALQKLKTTPYSLAVVSYPFFDQHRDDLETISISEVELSPKTLSDGSYPLSRSLYFYFHSNRVERKRSLKAYLQIFLSESMWGEEGPFATRGLIPVPFEEREKVRKELGIF